MTRLTAERGFARNRLQAISVRKHPMDVLRLVLAMVRPQGQGMDPSQEIRVCSACAACAVHNRRGASWSDTHPV